MIPSATNLSTLSLKAIRLRKPAFGRTLALASSNSARPASGVIAPTDADARSPASESARSIVLPAHEDRSEEHTSELQSLMRNSYAVLCLKKKQKQHKH